MQTKRRLWLRPPQLKLANTLLSLISVLIISSFQPAQCRQQQQQQQSTTSRLLLHPPNNQHHQTAQLSSHATYNTQQSQYNNLHHRIGLLPQALQQPQPQHDLNNLVNSGQAPRVGPRSAGLSLPSLTTRQQQAEPFDNVIESTSLGAPLALSELEEVSSGSSLFEDVQSEALQAAPRCQLPSTWAGKWYQANKEPIRITNTEISDKGVCRDQKGDKYLFEMSETSSRPGCIVCLVINERHLNVLQYKESNCQPVPPNGNNNSHKFASNSTTTNSPNLGDADHSLLEKACSDITGDAQLESMFRLDTPAIECPITGQYSFTYDYGSRLCRDPASSLNSCIDKKQLNFKFLACPDVPGSESKSEVLKCYADWSEGNIYYMIGRLEHASNVQDRGKFRCFVYERSPDGTSIQLAQSTDESCYGMINPNEGPKILHLTVKPPAPQKCSFPSYIRGLSENWPSVDNSLVYWFNQDSSKYSVKETLGGSVIEEAVCLQQFNYPNPYLPSSRINQAHQQQQQQQAATTTTTTTTTTNRRLQTTTPSSYNQVESPHQQHPRFASSSDSVYLVQITKSCQITNYCVRFYKRSDGIVQIDYFNSSRVGGQCRNAYFELPQTQIITSTTLDSQRCPLEGAYSIEAPMDSYLSYNPSNIFLCPRQSVLTAQCDYPSRLRIHSRCPQGISFVKNLHCLGSWTSNGLVRLLLADDDRQRYSAWFKDTTLPSLQDGGPSAQIHHTQLPINSSPQPPAQLASSLANNNNNNIDLHLALITPPSSITRTMHVRLTKRSQCSDLPGPETRGGGSSGSSWSSLPFYAPPSSGSGSPTLDYYPLSSMLMLLLPIVTLLMSWLLATTHIHHSLPAN